MSTTEQVEKPVIIRGNFLSRQVCVPASWTDDEVKEWTNREDLCGTTNGWCLRDEEPVRVPCVDRKDFVHIVLVA